MKTRAGPSARRPGIPGAARPDRACARRGATRAELRLSLHLLRIAHRLRRGLCLRRRPCLRLETRLCAAGPGPRKPACRIWLSVKRQAVRQAECSSGFAVGGARRDRTADLLIANEALSQLSYGPNRGRTRRPASSGRHLRLGVGRVKNRPVQGRFGRLFAGDRPASFAAFRQGKRPPCARFSTSSFSFSTCTSGC